MARIRSIKPDFWTDGKIRRLGDPTALFFLSLWTFADDYGFFCCDTLELSLRSARWRSQSVFRMLSSLADHGLIRVSSLSHVGLIVGWNHQKIKDRRASKWNESEIIWDEIDVNAQGSDRKPLGEERRGVERIGECNKETKKRTSPQTGRASALPLSHFSLDHALSLYPIKRKGTGCEKRFLDQIKTQQDYDDFLKSIENYKIELGNNPWRAPKQSLSTYLGSGESKGFWREYIVPVPKYTSELPRLVHNL